MIKASFFDLDETLVNAEHAHISATRKAFKHFGYDYDEVKKKSPYHVSMGRRVSDNLKARRDGAGITEQEMPLQELIAIRQKYFLASLETEAVLLPGALGALQFMKRHKSLVAIVSSGTRAYLDKIMQMFSLKRVIDFVVTGDEVNNGKPDPECYRYAYTVARRIIPTLLPDECMVFEDTEAGVTAGKKAGMRVVYIPTPKSVAPTELLPDITLHSLEEIESIPLSHDDS